MRRKLTVETPYGTVTRTTERDYQFVVVSFGQSEASQRARYDAGRQASLDVAAKYERWISKATYGVYHEVYNGGYGHADHTVEDLAKYAAEARERADAKPFSFNQVGLVVHGWSGSARGAASMVAEAEKYGYLGIIAVPVAEA